LKILLDLFHEDGNGLSLQQMKKSKEYKKLDAELKLRSANTADLVKLFYLQVICLICCCGIIWLYKITVAFKLYSYLKSN